MWRRKLERKKEKSEEMVKKKGRESKEEKQKVVKKKANIKKSKYGPRGTRCNKRGTGTPALPEKSWKCRQVTSRRSTC